MDEFNSIRRSLNCGFRSGAAGTRAKLRTQLTLFGITSAYGASLIYGTTFKTSVLNNYKKDLIRAASTTTGAIGVGTLKRKND